jgi:hypothetical protein
MHGLTNLKNYTGRASVLYNNSYTVIRYNNIQCAKPATFVGLVLPSSGRYSTHKDILMAS